MGVRLEPGLAALLALLCFAGAGHAAPDPGPVGIGVEERTGARLPAELSFRDESGAAVRLGDLADRPLLVTFVYHSCTRRCPLVLGGLAEALGRLALRPGEDYAVVAISIDERDTPASAAAAKRNYLAAAGVPFPPAAWTFLTGDRQAIARATAAAGVGFERHGEHFFHPTLLLAVAPGGVISSYLPVEIDRSNVRSRIVFQPVELQMALAAAGRGQTRAGRPHEPLFCFPHEGDPERSFYAILKLFGVANLLALGGVLAYVLRAGRSPGRKRET